MIEYGLTKYLTPKKNSGKRTPIKQKDLAIIAEHWAITKKEQGHNKVIYIDLNGGAGKYVENGETIPGSHIVVSTAFNKVGVEFENYYFEQNGFCNDSLKAELKKKKFDTAKHTVLADNNYVISLLAKLDKNVPILVYHDPHGVCRDELVESIASYNKDIDILLQAQATSHKRSSQRWPYLKQKYSILGNLPNLRNTIYLTWPEKNVGWTFALLTNNKQNTPSILNNTKEFDGSRLLNRITMFKQQALNYDYV